MRLSSWCSTYRWRPSRLLQIPTIGFLYVAGWLGWSGSKYLQEAKKATKPIEKEIIIDVPLVSTLVGGLAWVMSTHKRGTRNSVLEVKRCSRAARSSCNPHPALSTHPANMPC